MPDSELNFMIKLRHITTYLESGVTAARVEIYKFLTFLIRSFFKLKTPTQSFRLKTTTSYLFCHILTILKSVVTCLEYNVEALLSGKRR